MADSNVPNKVSQETQLAQDRFVLEWGRMSSSWGINRTMAQIHALLLATGHALTMDEIIERLHISRGNASMNLRDLVDWGIVTRTREPGDRKDLYHAGDDVLDMFARVVKERKRREIDPTVLAIRDCLELVPESDATPEARALRLRLSVLLEVFDLADRIYKEVFEAEHAFRDVMKLREQAEPLFPRISPEPEEG